MRIALLALLAREPAHGYELKQALKTLLGAAYPQPSIGRVYLILGKLEKAGLIVGEDVKLSNAPNKYTYRLTAAGHEALEAWYEETATKPRVRDEFFMKLALAPHSDMTDQRTLINKQRRQYLNTMRDLSELSAAEEHGNCVAQLLIEGAILHLQADLDWLERCQEELERHVPRVK